MRATGQATDDELKFLDHVFSAATFVVRPDGYYDAGTEARLINCMYLIGNCGQPCGLFRGKRDGSDDEEMCAFSEFDVTWPDESISLDGEK